MGVILDARQELFLTSLYIQLFYNNYLRGRIGSMFKRCAQEKDRVTLCAPYYPYMHTLMRSFLNRMYIGWTTRHFFIMFCLTHVLFLPVSFFFLSMRLTDEHGTHRFYDISRYPPSQPGPLCTFPWLLDKLRWTQAIVTAVSHFLVQNRVRILRTGQHTPTKNFQEYPLGDLKPGSKFTCQHPLANYQML